MLGIDANFGEDLLVVVHCRNGAGERQGPEAASVVAGVPHGGDELVGGNAFAFGKSSEGGERVVFRVGGDELVVHNREVGRIASGGG